MKVNHATINNAEVVLNALFLHNIPYHANYYDIEYVLKPLIHIKELILFLDSNNQFKGCAKLLVEKKEDFQKLLTYSEFLKKLFKEYKILEIIILNNKNNNQKFSFVTFQNEDLRDKALSFDGIFIYKKKIFIKKAFEKKNFKKKNITPTNNINNNFNEILEKRIINLENEIKKLKLIIDNNSNSIINLNKNSENKINKNFEKGAQTQKRNPKTNYKEINKNKNENLHYEEKSIEIDIEKEDDVNKSKNKIINKQKK
ncbi:heterogeneous nuclear ribonucleoprotein a0a-related [Anaeramoeba flamelloides]|uniref:Heterogeneous nuclear ribonucleoprotein a0a-related n=1 Tax=Anaeramoeba flamelloides TaxID=1746091 RepID=A0AAV7YL04_9EUKA|nr:heterogeneous nuclear ribonucleoprotein a0a-related [Anaeramoeba flamelloides]